MTRRRWLDPFFMVQVFKLRFELCWGRSPNKSTWCCNDQGKRIGFSLRFPVWNGYRLIIRLWLVQYSDGDRGASERQGANGDQ